MTIHQLIKESPGTEFIYNILSFIYFTCAVDISSLHTILAHAAHSSLSPQYCTMHDWTAPGSGLGRSKRGQSVFENEVQKRLGHLYPKKSTKKADWHAKSKLTHLNSSKKDKKFKKKRKKFIYLFFWNWKKKWLVAGQRQPTPTRRLTWAKKAIPTCQKWQIGGPADPDPLFHPYSCRHKFLHFPSSFLPRFNQCSCLK